MDEYRDQLAAAHARIAALEEELARKATTGDDVFDAKVRQLEQRRDEARKRASPRAIRKVALRAGIGPALLFILPILFLTLTGPIPATDAIWFGGAGVTLGALLGGLMLWLMTPATRAAVTKAEQDLAEAVRMRALEQEIRETRQRLDTAEPRVRVDAPAASAQEAPRDALDQEPDPEDERAQRERTQSRS